MNEWFSCIDGMWSSPFPRYSFLPVVEGFAPSFRRLCVRTSLTVARQNECGDSGRPGRVGGVVEESR